MYLCFLCLSSHNAILFSSVEKGNDQALPTRGPSCNSGCGQRPNSTGPASQTPVQCCTSDLADPSRRLDASTLPLTLGHRKNGWRYSRGRFSHRLTLLRDSLGGCRLSRSAGFFLEYVQSNDQLARSSEPNQWRCFVDWKWISNNWCAVVRMFLSIIACGWAV